MVAPMAARIWRCRTHSRPSQLRAYSRVSEHPRQRLSKFWTPTGLLQTEPKDHNAPNQKGGLQKDDSASLLARAGYLSQVQSGIFHMLPLGLRVQNKLETLIDKHMDSIGAAKTSLSSITTEALWKKSGRYSTNSELLRIKDRRKSGFLLSPTHEEEITTLVAASLKSYKDLPIRLYQIGRKYRDERRPRNGLLRAKEFMMKDLYTFDYTHETALETYKAVRTAYNNLFRELGIPFIVAEADSGNMGGKLSHEYHFVHPSGEDKIWICDQCEYVANEELAEHKTEARPFTDVMVFTAISADHKTRISIHVGVDQPKDSYDSIHWDHLLNPHALRKAAENLNIDLATGLEPDTLRKLLENTTSTIDIYDIRLQNHIPEATHSPATRDILAIEPGDACPKCENGHLSQVPGIEVGHTFHLGTRYSEPLNAVVATPNNTEKVPVHMGCHGIGVSRLISAVAAMTYDERGLNWPPGIAPYEVVVIPGSGIESKDGEEVYDSFKGAGLDVVLDDRADKNLGWKLKDADLIGYPVIVVLGKTWKSEAGGKVEVQCRRLGEKKLVEKDEVAVTVADLLRRCGKWENPKWVSSS
ncbi:prolyl-tRNA synthetase [Westerdykella ornata]|uniref:proline--tRNA ligase n=1 Tax=Westerdykella ornata TaxID=318751 RepID=A0A6A6JI02_WESOR|nr:prolyl-tRNA synthetase [Westerdykella ornata]KAF2276181.1 prolyl-tRNA synthetase [Westerdykella ornata]